MAYFNLKNMVKNVVFIFLVCISCVSKENKNNFQGNSIIPEFQFVDTLFIDSPYFIYASKYDDKILGYNPWNNDVLVFDLKNKKMDSFNKYGSGPEDYLLLYHNLGFNERGDIIIGGVKGFKIYRQNGEFLMDFPVDRKSTFAPVLYPFEKKNQIIGVNLPQGSSSDPEFFKKDHNLLLTFDQEKQIIEEIPGFQFKKLNSHEGFYLNNGLSISAYSKDKIFLMDQNEPVVRVYDIISQKEENPISLKLEYFEPYLLPFNKKFTPNQIKLLSSMNSTIHGFFVQENLIFIFYSLAYSEEEINDFYYYQNAFGESVSPPLRYGLHISDILGNPLVGDLKIPQEYGIPITISEGEILFLKEGINKKTLSR